MKSESVKLSVTLPQERAGALLPEVNVNVGSAGGTAGYVCLLDCGEL